MKKQLVALLSAFVIALSPVVAFAQPSPAGAVASATSNGVTASARAHSGELVIDPYDQDASNAVEVEGFEKLASFHVYETAEGATSPDYHFTYNLGAAYAGGKAIVYIDHQGTADNEVKNLDVDANGTISFTTEALSIHTIYVQKGNGTVAATDNGAKSPQTGLSTNAVVAGTVTAIVVAAGAALVLKRDAE